jgi:hypothetical protein
MRGMRVWIIDGLAFVLAAFGLSAPAQAAGVAPPKAPPKAPPEASRDALQEAPQEAPLKVAPDGRQLVLAFADDFSAFRPLCQGGRRWRTTFGDGGRNTVDARTLSGNGELEVYVDPCLAGAPAGLRLDPFRTGPEGLEIIAEPARPELAPALEGHPYASGLITTQPSFSQTYGYFEMKARLPRGQGLWPAFWLLPTDQSWPPEIDVIESIGDPGVIYQTVHSKVADQAGEKVEVPRDPDGFHVFAVEWDPRWVVWYVDGRETARKPTPPDADKPMYMLVNLAVGGHWPGAPDASTRFPAAMTVRWVRAYRFVP